MAAAQMDVFGVLMSVPHEARHMAVLMIASIISPAAASMSACKT